MSALSRTVPQFSRSGLGANAMGQTAPEATSAADIAKVPAAEVMELPQKSSSGPRRDRTCDPLIKSCLASCQRRILVRHSSDAIPTAPLRILAA
jgi:hypothetical protein